MTPHTIMQFDLVSEGTRSTYRIEDDPEQDTLLHLDRMIGQTVVLIPEHKRGVTNRWEGLETTDIEPEGDSMEDAILRLVKFALRDTRS